MKKLLIPFAIVSIFFLESCNKDTGNSVPPVPPVPSELTSAIDSIMITTAKSGGNITSDGGSPITARGIVWSTNSSPTVSLATKTVDGTGMGSFVSKMTGLTEKTTYYVKAYATNSTGTGYGNELTFVTRGPVSMPSVTICSQVWMSNNLTSSTYKNGDVIPKITDGTAWASLTTGAWCWYNNDSATYSIYGKLYNWYAVNDPRGLAPLGWHIPSDVEFATLSTCLGGDAAAGGALKEAGIAHWVTPNTGAINSNGFTGLPSGNRDLSGNFNNMGKYGSFWNATQFDAGTAWFRYLSYQDAILSKYNREKTFGYGVRCIKD